MPKKIQPVEDEWFGVQDAKKRKQIQDRLAQRARRVRLAKSSKKQRTPPPCRTESPSPNSSLDLVSLKSHQSQSFKKANHQFPSRGLITPSLEPRLSQDHSYLTLSVFTLCSALYYNGIILGIPCVTSGIHRSQPAEPHVPTPLRPIQIQLDQVHYSFIDRIPAKGLRHNMILLDDDLNAEEFTADLFTIPSFILAPGCQTWDASGWSVAAEFRNKWSTLFANVDIKTA